MQRPFAALCFILLIAGAVHASAQINPYKDGTPGVAGFRSEVLPK